MMDCFFQGAVGSFVALAVIALLVGFSDDRWGGGS